MNKPIATPRDSKIIDEILVKTFIENKYTNWYYSIIRNPALQNRKKKQGIYYESHHIIPKGLDGNNLSENLILLTPKEHYICHILLPKICISKGHRAQMVYALMRLRESRVQPRERIYSSRGYQLIKEKYIQMISGENSHLFGVPKSEEIKQKISKSVKSAWSKFTEEAMAEKTRKQKESISNRSRAKIKEISSVNSKNATIQHRNMTPEKKQRRSNRIRIGLQKTRGAAENALLMMSNIFLFRQRVARWESQLPLYGID